MIFKKENGVGEISIVRSLELMKETKGSLTQRQSLVDAGARVTLDYRKDSDTLDQEIETKGSYAPMTVRKGKSSAPDGKFPGQKSKNGLINFSALADE